MSIREKKIIDIDLDTRNFKRLINSLSEWEWRCLNNKDDDRTRVPHLIINLFEDYILILRCPEAVEKKVPKKKDEGVCKHPPDGLFTITEKYTSDTVQKYIQCQCGAQVSGMQFSPIDPWEPFSMKKEKYVPSQEEIDRYRKMLEANEN